MYIHSLCLVISLLIVSFNLKMFLFWFSCYLIVHLPVLCCKIFFFLFPWGGRHESEDLAYPSTSFSLHIMHPKFMTMMFFQYVGFLMFKTWFFFKVQLRFQLWLTDFEEFLIDFFLFVLFSWISIVINWFRWVSNRVFSVRILVINSQLVHIG